MFDDGFKTNYKTIPFAYYKQSKQAVELGLFLHHHKELELIAMIDGAADFYVDAVCYELKAGDVLVIPPYCTHRADIYPQTNYDCICFDLSLLWDRALREGLENGFLTNDGHLSSKQPYTADMNHCVRNAIAAYQRGKSGWEMDVIGNLSLIFGTLKENDFFVKSSIAIPEHIFAKNVFKYITEHYFEPITSRTAAMALHLNNSYFCRLFKKNFGCNFSEYLITFRLEKAKQLLKSGSDEISDIASKTGFFSFSYFSKTFKKAVGVTPSQYRKQNRR